MKKINVGHDLYALVDDDDFEYLNKWLWHVDSSGYARRSTHIKDNEGKRKSVAYLMHRVINNTPDNLDTDYINHNKLDNRKQNLRSATRNQNMTNARKKNMHGFRGVYQKDAKTFYAQLSKDYKKLFLGTFKTAEAAAKAYDEKAKQIYGKFAITNF